MAESVSEPTRSKRDRGCLFILTALACAGSFSIGFATASRSDRWAFTTDQEEYHLVRTRIGDPIVQLRSAAPPPEMSADRWIEVSTDLGDSFSDATLTRDPSRLPLADLEDFGVRWPDERIREAKSSTAILEELEEDISSLEGQHNRK